MASRLIARRAHSFRVQPSFSYFRKMNVALCRLQELNLYSEFERMKKAIKSSCKINGGYHLPTKSNFRYFLIRLQSYAKLLVRIVVCAKESHRLFLEIIHRSAFVEISTLFMAVTAQIYKECVTICRQIAQLYDAFIIFCKKYFDEKELPDHLSEWLGDEWTEHIAVNPQLNAKHPRKYQNNIILFNAFDELSKKQLLSMDTDATDGDAIDSTELKPSTPIFAPKFIINSGMRPINLNDPNKLTRAQQFKVKQHQKAEKLIEAELRNKIKAARNMERKMRPLNFNESFPMAGSSTSTADTDMGEKIDRNAFQTENKIVKLENLAKFKKIKLDVNKLKSGEAIRKFMVTEDLLRRQGAPNSSQGISGSHWKRVKNTVDQLLILGQEKMAVRKFHNFWQNTFKQK